MYVVRNQSINTVERGQALHITWKEIGEVGKECFLVKVRSNGSLPKLILTLPMEQNSLRSSTMQLGST